MLGFGSNHARPRRRLFTRLASSCKYCDEPARSTMTWPDSEDAAVCNAHGSFVVSAMGEVALLVRGVHG